MVIGQGQTNAGLFCSFRVHIRTNILAPIRLVQQTANAEFTHTSYISIKCSTRRFKKVKKSKKKESTKVNTQKTLATGVQRLTKVQERKSVYTLAIIRKRDNLVLNRRTLQIPLFLNPFAKLTLINYLASKLFGD